MYSRLDCLRMTETSRERGVLSTGYRNENGKSMSHAETNPLGAGHLFPPMFARDPTVALIRPGNCRDFSSWKRMEHDKQFIAEAIPR